MSIFYHYPFEFMNDFLREKYKFSPQQPDTMCLLSLKDIDRQILFFLTYEKSLVCCCCL